MTVPFKSTLMPSCCAYSCGPKTSSMQATKLMQGWDDGQGPTLGHTKLAPRCVSTYICTDWRTLREKPLATAAATLPFMASLFVAAAPAAAPHLQIMVAAASAHLAPPLVTTASTAAARRSSRAGSAGKFR
jgi:hypothetical protein